MRRRNLAVLFLLPVLSVASTDPVEQARGEVLAAYQHSLDALRRADADGALQIEAKDWTSITVGQKPRTLQEMEPFIRRDIAGMKPPPDWNVVWKPDYARNGTATGIQIYDFSMTADTAIALCLVGDTHSEVVDGTEHRVWKGSHVRDTWIKTSAGWKRRMHEKLTVDELMIDGHPARL